MKASRYLLIALLVVLILAATSWILRNSIIQRLSAPVLSEYGMSISDVSLDALATENARISHLALEHDNGTRIAIDELTLPIGTPAGEMRKFAAGKVTIGIPEKDDQEPLALARLIDRLLLLPDTLQDTVVMVDELSVAPYPAVHDIQWSSDASRQKLTASLGVVDLSLQIDTQDGVSFDSTVSMTQTSLDGSDQTFLSNIELTEAGVRLSGMSSLSLSSIGAIATSIAASFGTTLAGVEFASGSAAIHHEWKFPYDTSLPAPAITTIIPEPPFEFAYSVKPGIVNVVSVRSASPVRIETMFPEGQWSLDTDEVSLSMSYDDWSDMVIELADLSCANGPSCLMNIEATLDNADLTFATVGRLELAVAQEIAFADEEVQLLIRPDARMALSELDVGGTRIDRMNAQLSSSATLQLSDSGWQLSADSLDALVESLALDDEMTFSAPLSLSNLGVGATDQAIAMKTAIDFAPGRLRRDGLEITVPAFKGLVTMQEENVVTELTTVGLHNDASINARHNLATDSGSIRFSHAALSFDAERLSDRVSPWPNDWDISAGTISFDLHFNWQNSGSGWQLDGESSVQMMNLAGSYTDTVFAGLSTSVFASVNADTGISVAPANIEIALLEVGLPIENISADYTLHPDAMAVDMVNLEMQAFGGTVTADPFTYDWRSERNTLLLHAESIELAELLTVKEFEAIELSGSIGAELPVIIEGREISILEGTLTGEAPGGVIRYQPEFVPGENDVSAIGIVTEALSNFEYDTLTSTVGYGKDGDLVLQMQIAGRNPDMEDSRPVVLNLGVENNIPQMLRSLKAARAVEEILEKRVTK